MLSILCIGTLAYTALFLVAIGSNDTELVQALTIAPILIGLTVPIALKIARTDRDPTLAGIVMAGVVFKLLAAYVRFYVAFEVYGSARTDSQQYHEAGVQLAPQYRRLNFATDIGSLIGTGFVRMFTGIVYAIFGMSRPAGFFVFAWLGFLGLLLAARAFRIGVPNGNSRRYMILVLFVPTLAYWPSAIGKEAWMMLALGLCAYGIASMFQRRAGGLVIFAAGIAATVVVRPHMGLLVFAGVVFALLVRRAPARTFAAPLFRMLGVAALLVLGLFLVSRTSAFLEKTNVSTDSITATLSDTADRTGDGGSEFNPVTVNNPIALGPAFVTVYFRPFPFEVSSVQELATAAEGLLLVGLLIASRKRLRSIPRLIRTQPYVAFCVGFVVATTVAFSSFANFGILARQRAQAIPFLLVLIALPRFQDLVNPPAAAAAPAGGQAPEVPRPAVAPTPRRRARRPAAEVSERVPVSSGTSFPPPARVPR